MKKFKQKITATLRGRVTLLYLTSIGLILLIFSSVVIGLFRITLQNQIDHHIYIAVNEARQVLLQSHAQERDLLIKNLVGAQGMTVVVLSPDGSPVLETNSPDISLVTEHQLQKILTSTNPDESDPVHFTQGNIRFAAMPVQVNAGKGIVAVGYSTKVLQDTFYRMLAVSAGAFILLVLPAAYIGYTYLKMQLLPIENIASQASSITHTSDLAKRIQMPSSSEELNTVQAAFNSMLSKLETIFSRERDFFSDAAHTLKTPLAVLRSQVEASQIPAGNRDGMLHTIDTANETIQDLILLSRIGNKIQETEPVSLTDILLNLSELATTLGMDKSLSISSDIESGVIIRGNKQLLQKAFNNLVLNAINYNKPGGSIKLSLASNAGRAVVTIEDTGVGISAEDRPKVFTRFFRGSNASHKGSGLGLAIAKASIEVHNGTISLTSSLNEGTTITVELPIT